MSQTHFLRADKIKIKRREGELLLKMDGQCVPLAPPRRTLPISSPDEFIALSDGDGHEIGIVRRVADLEPDSRAILEDELSRIYDAIIIERVLEIQRDPISGQTKWRVEVESDDDEAAAPLPILKRPVGVKLLSRARKKTEESDLPGEVTSARELTFFIAGTEDVQNARYPRIFIGDTEGRKYEIPNCEELDLVSRRLGERYF